MGRSTTEVEIKLPFPSADAARRRLADLGAVPRDPRVFEDNLVFDRTADPLRSTGRLLRLRRCGPTALLTFKSPTPGDPRFKVREEHETAVVDGDATRRILEGLGFRTIYRYQKHRTSYAWDELAIALDETPLGCFVELEGPPEAIERAARALGFTPEAYVRESYRELQEREARRRGMAEPGDLLVEPDAGPRG